MSQDEKEVIQSELASPQQLCPDISQFTVKGQFLATSQLVLRVGVSEEGKKYDGTHYILLEHITRAFDAKTYRQQGYMDPASVK